MAEFTGMSYALKTVRIGQWNLVLVTDSVLKGTCVLNLVQFIMHPLNAQSVDQRDPGSFWTIRLLYGEKTWEIYEIYEILASIIGRLQIQFLNWPILTTSPEPCLNGWKACKVCCLPSSWIVEGFVVVPGRTPLGWPVINMNLWIIVKLINYIFQIGGERVVWVCAYVFHLISLWSWRYISCAHVRCFATANC